MSIDVKETEFWMSTDPIHDSLSCEIVVAALNHPYGSLRGLIDALLRQAQLVVIKFVAEIAATVFVEYPAVHTLDVAGSVLDRRTEGSANELSPK